MPYASQAQRGMFHVMQKRGQISPWTVREFDKASKGMKLPEHVKKEGGTESPWKKPSQKKLDDTLD